MLAWAVGQSLLGRRRFGEWPSLVSEASDALEHFAKSSKPCLVPACDNHRCIQACLQQASACSVQALGAQRSTICQRTARLRRPRAHLVETSFWTLDGPQEQPEEEGATEGEDSTIARCVTETSAIDSVRTSSQKNLSAHEKHHGDKGRTHARSHREENSLQCGDAWSARARARAHVHLSRPAEVQDIALCFRSLFEKS